MTLRFCLAAIGLLGLTGCGGLGPVLTGLGTAGVAASVGSATGSPVLGVLAGAGVAYGVDETVSYAERRITDNVHRAIASAAGPLDLGKSAAWHVDEKLPLNGKTGTVQVARSFGETIPCKDIVFTLDGSPDLNVTTICQAKDGRWQWALAEPATRRWGSLQ